jgi:tetratricopeptide (TPR) repeat protein
MGGGGGYGGHGAGGWSGGHSGYGQFQGSHGISDHAAHDFGHDASHGWDHHGNWNHDQAWWHNHGHYWPGWWGGGGYWGPWFDFGWWPGYYGYYGYYGYADIAPYYYRNAYVDYGYATPYTAAYAPSDAAANPATPEAVDTAGMGFYSHALDAFQQGDYRNATRLAGHASIDDPRSPEVHTLLMLGLFAIGEYRGAAMEAHAVGALGKTPDWPKLYSFYGNVAPYTEQLRALEKYVGKNPAAPEGRFLLGYQYLMAGHRDAAKDEFLRALKLAPKDKLAARFLKQVGGTVPADIAPQLAPPPPPKPGNVAEPGKDKDNSPAKPAAK